MYNINVCIHKKCYKNTSNSSLYNKVLTDSVYNDIYNLFRVGQYFEPKQKYYFIIKKINTKIVLMY